MVYLAESAALRFGELRFYIHSFKEAIQERKPSGRLRMKCRLKKRQSSKEVREITDKQTSDLLDNARKDAR